jgi:hypothetical protein
MTTPVAFAFALKNCYVWSFLKVPTVFLKYFWLLDPGGGFASESETAARPFQNRNSRYETVSEVKRLKTYNGYM